MTPRTLGEAVEQHGYCVAMLKIAELAEVLHRVPFGEWDHQFVSDARWRLCVNGGQQEVWHVDDAIGVPRYHAYVEFNGWPAGLIDPAGGTIAGNLEDDLIVALESEIQRARERG
jgi:hypothetical protein